jgi:hypothetical protein
MRFLAGHRDTRMVERHYGHVAPSYEIDAIRAGAPEDRYRERGYQPGEMRLIATLRGP